MQRYDIYKDISERTNGDVYIGVVGPVRTGKSTFISKFIEKLVVPNISDSLERQIAIDEMPQSADGRTIMTTQPKFIPANAVKVQFKNKATAKVRLVDCVGYFVEGATGHEEENKPRLVKTPWSEEEIPFEKAAEIGTKKVIDEYSTIGILVTTDGSFGELARDNFVSAEEKVVKQLKKQNKPFLIVLNTTNPTSKECLSICSRLEEKYGVSVVPTNVSQLSENDINVIMEKVLLEFPMQSFDVDIPKWLRTLPPDNEIIMEVVDKVKKASQKVNKMRDYVCLNEIFDDSENFMPIEVCDINLGTGCCNYKVQAKENLFYTVLSNECGNEIQDDYQLMSFVKSFAKEKREYEKVKDALKIAEEEGYGVVMPSLQEMNLEEPVLVKQNGQYGVKLKASAPSLHIMKVDVSTEVSPIVGTEKQGEDLVNSLMSQFEDNPNGIWETNMFGKSLHDLVNEGLSSKLVAMPNEAKNKMRRTLTKIVNENKGGIICILL